MRTKHRKSGYPWFGKFDIVRLIEEDEEYD
jgi:hypothetical protein